jgi:hypothetical protein
MLTGTIFTTVFQKIKNMLKKITLMAVIPMMFFGCNKNEDSNNYLTTLFPAGGFIQGEISGERSDGTSFTVTFNHGFYESQDQLYTYDNPFATQDIYYCSIDRLSSGTLPVNGGSSISFSMLSKTAPYSLDDLSFSCNVLSDLGNGSTLDFNFDFWNGGSSGSIMNISNFNYNQANRTASGEFIIYSDGSDNSTGNPATISGTFQSVPMLQTISKGIQINNKPIALEK